MSSSKQEKTITQLFRGSILYKAATSLVEVLVGVTAFFISPMEISSFIRVLVHSEYIEDPHNIIVSHLLQIASQISIAPQVFVALYLIARGGIQLMLAIALIFNKLWAYPASLIVFALLITYQTYQMVLSFSVFLLLLTIFDLFVLYFIWKEYNVVKKHLLQ